MNRRDSLKTLAMMGLSSIPLSTFSSASLNFSRTSKMPVVFVGHGHPMNAILNNDFTQSLEKLGKAIETPNAILVISAHWETEGTYVSTNAWPKTIYDFGNFDQRLFEIKYEPQGQPALAREVMKTVTLTTVKEDPRMGLDHGAWTVLKFMYPLADVPVFQLSIDYTKGPEFHFDLGKQLATLRGRGVLMVSSGNIVHNLYDVDWNNINAKPHDWNVEFDALVKQKLTTRQFESLVHYDKLGAAAQMAIPTNDHYLPMLYTLGLAGKSEPITQLYEGYQYAGLSMRCFQIG